MHMSIEWTVSAARAALPEIIRQVEAGEEVRLTRHSAVVAVIVRPDALKVRRAAPSIDQANELRDRLVQAAGWTQPPGGIDRDRAEELAADIRADRDR